MTPLQQSILDAAKTVTSSDKPMNLLKCECGNDSFIKKHVFEPYNKEFYTRYIAMVCDKCCKQLPIEQHEVIGGF